ncbi:MAG: hypothetical protein LBD24_09540, partial [Spirochaetaceae bacterium]|nr:hypothetical protein [Spirochaetaceae bacterium]
TFHNPSAGGPSPTVLNSFPRSAPNRRRRRHKSFLRSAPNRDCPHTTPRPLLRATTRRPRTVGDCAKRSRAWAAIRLLTGQGVAPFGNNRRPC